MAERRMFAKTIIDSDAFLDMPLSTQALYFHLSMRADDEGFVNNPKKIARSDTMRSKYGARKTVFDGIAFDSKREADRYRELKLLEKAGKIKDLRLQVPFELIPALYTYTGDVYKRGAKKGKLKPSKCIERPVKYIADFVYTEILPAPQYAITVVEDAKGMRTKDYIIKRKLFRYRYGKYYEFREV